MTLLPDTSVIQLVDIHPVKIHDSVYYDVRYRVEGDTSVRELRVNPEVFYKDPRPGDLVEVNMIMGNILEATKLN